MTTRTTFMQIESFYVKGLFGHFDHEVPLSVDDRITIIHGPNGTGKTAMLKLLHGLFNIRFSALFEIPFLEFGVRFDDGSILTAEKLVDEIENSPDSETINLSFRGQEWPFSRHSYQKYLHAAERTFRDRHPAIQQIGAETWLTIAGGSAEVRLFQDQLSAEEDMGCDKLKPRVPNWLLEIKAAAPVSLIRTNRLTNPVVRKRHRLTAEIPAQSVEEYADDLVSRFQIVLSHYASVAEKLERSFPERVIHGKVQTYNRSEAEQRIAQLEGRRQRLQNVGLISIAPDLPAYTTENVDDRQLEILSAYLTDSEEKLSVLEPFAAQLQLFTEIINNKFRHKKIHVSNCDGIVFLNDNGDKFFAAELSSGEQHQLILAYELLFGTPPNALVLIDEPEISLHIAWQQTFMSDLDRTTALGKYRALVATHAPSIIYNRWDLTVELKDRINEAVAHGI